MSMHTVSVLVAAANHDLIEENAFHFLFIAPRSCHSHSSIEDLHLVVNAYAYAVVSIVALSAFLRPDLSLGLLDEHRHYMYLGRKKILLTTTTTSTRINTKTNSQNFR
ncbi:unnamed protein product [Amoebophrya sp. A25]|nr:unnamed protein product [Amoebophrya sp. A25]|eukprot:GSA25T00022323001.1